MAKKATKSRAGTTGSGGSIRQKIHDLTLRAVRDNDLSLSEIPDLAGQVVRGAAEGLDRAVPKSGKNVLRQVFDGLRDAATAAAKATRTAASTASERGTSFIKKDVKGTAEDFAKLESAFLDSVQKAGRSLSGSAKQELDTIVTEAKKAGTKIRPAMKSVAKAADGRLMELGREAAGAGAQATKTAVGTILHGAGGFLEGLADAVTKPAAPAKKSTPRKKTAKNRKRKIARR